MTYGYEDRYGTIHEFVTFAALVAFVEAAYSAREGRPIEFEGMDELVRDTAQAGRLMLHELRP